LLATYPFPGNVRELKALTYDAVSLHSGGVLSMERFINAIGPRAATPTAASPERRNPFLCCERLPTFSEAAELLVTEAMQRSNGNQTIAARLLGISQPALSKRLKQRETQSQRTD
jgi:DNA-binding NtrC family response regulator